MVKIYYNNIIFERYNMKYMRVMFGTKSYAGGFEYKLNEVNQTNNWNPKADNPEDFGGFNFSTEDKILRWLLRGDTIYDVEILDDAEVIECENKNTPHGVFRSNKIILKNPRTLTKEIVMNEKIKLIPYTDADYEFVYGVKKDAYKKYVEEC